MDTIFGRFGPTLVLLFSLLLSGCKGRTTGSVIDIQVLSAKEYYDDAFAVAREWQSDAYLQSADAIARQLYDSYPPLRLSYSFLSQSKRSQALLVFIREDLSVDSEVVNLGGSVEDRREIQTTQWMLDTTDAIQVAQEAGGNQYISEYGAVETTAFLEHRKKKHTDTVIWRILFLRSGAAENLVVEVDAMSGDVLEVRE